MLIEVDLVRALDELILKREREGLEEVMGLYLENPRTLKDICQYLEKYQNSSWLQEELQERPLFPIWFACYLKQFPSEVMTIFEYEQFSHRPVGKDRQDKYGVIDLVLNINYSNRKGIPLGVEEGEASKEFFSSSPDKLASQLYPSMENSGGYLTSSSNFCPLNPPPNRWKEWRLFHLRMRWIAFRFLHFLMDSGISIQIILQYARSLSVRDWKYSSLSSIGDRLLLENNQRSMLEDRIDFFLSPEDELLFPDSEKLRKKITSLSSDSEREIPGRDYELVVESGISRRVKEMMENYGEKIAIKFREGFI